MACNEASDQQVKASLKKTSAKSKAQPKQKATAKTGPPQPEVEKADKHPRSPPKVDQASPNPAASKRVKGKQPNPDMAQQLDDLREAHQIASLLKIILWFYTVMSTFNGCGSLLWCQLLMDNWQMD